MPESEKALSLEVTSSRAYQRRAQLLERALSLLALGVTGGDLDRAGEIVEAAIQEARKEAKP